MAGEEIEPMSRSKTIQALIENSNSFTIDMLEKLSDAQLREIEATDTNWCETDWEHNGFDSAEEAVSAALFATFEYITQ